MAVVLLIVGITLVVVAIEVGAVVVTWVYEPNELSRGELLSVATITFAASVVAGRVKLGKIADTVLALAEAASYDVRHLAVDVEVPTEEAASARYALLNAGFEHAELQRDSDAPSLVRVSAWLYRPPLNLRSDDVREMAERALAARGISYRAGATGHLPEDARWFRSR